MAEPEHGWRAAQEHPCSGSAIRAGNVGNSPCGLQDSEGRTKKPVTPVGNAAGRCSICLLSQSEVQENRDTDDECSLRAAVKQASGGRQPLIS